ncbi:MAG: hypothetical protein AMXMBFR33_54850 [Candidatus Xenobia bacterium]|jgi:hypothetical protein
MSEIARYACPVVLTNTLLIWLFLLIPGLLAALGAYLTRGSWMRIVGASVGAAARDILALFVAVILPDSARNPEYAPYYSWFVAYLCASGAAVMSCLSPYRGGVLYFMAGVGGFAGQFVLLYTNESQKLLRNLLRMALTARSAA